MRSIKKVAVAARGEIACQIISVCREMSLKTVLLFAEGDEQNEAFRQAEERLCIGPAEPLRSYLNIEAHIEGALGAGAQALHPGYGFLAESPALASACLAKGIVFIGPPAGALSLLGNKLSAKQTASHAGLAVLPSLPFNGRATKELFKKARALYPVMIKSASGGGGQGLFVAQNEEGLKNFIETNIKPAKNSKEPQFFLEKHLDSAKHIEVQIFVSAVGELFLLGDRDCSVQRRHQKIIEEAPSNLPEKTKKKLFSACKALLSGLDYQGAGTVEFLVQGEDFYFMEMNPRLQVEHPVTEMTCGLDLVRAQILTAMGSPPFYGDNKSPAPSGHSIECRICAEDPDQNFRPAGGKLIYCKWPQGKNIRVDAGFQTGDWIPSLYDSLIGKIAVWDTSRTRAISKMKRALEETIVFGMKTNIAFLHFLLSHIRFLERQMTSSSAQAIHAKEWRAEPCPLPEGLIKNLFDQLEPEGLKASPPLKANPWSDFLKR